MLSSKLSFRSPGNQGFVDKFVIGNGRRSTSWIKNQEILRERTVKETEDVKLFLGKSQRLQRS